MEEMHRIAGARAILPLDHEYFTFIKKVIRYHARRSGLKRISLPAFESKDYLNTVLGESSDVMQKELVAIEGTDLALRPYYAPGVLRAFHESDMSTTPMPVEYYFIDNVFRKNPETGALVQPYEFGFQILGEEDPALDVQLIQMSKKIFMDLGFKNVKLRINNVGSRASQEKYAEDLRNFFAGKERSLSDQDLLKLEKNPLLIMSSTEEDTKILLGVAPKISSVLDKASKEHYARLKEYLDILEIEYEENDLLFSPADFCSKIFFQFYTEIDGEEFILGQGARFDETMKRVFGTDVPGLCFGSDMELLASLMKQIHLRVPSKDKAQIFIVQLGDDAKRLAVKLISDLRGVGIKAVGALGKGPIRSQLESASKFEVEYALVIGQMEVLEKKIIIRNMKKGTQEILPMADIVEYMADLIGRSHLDTKDFLAMIEEATENDE